MNNITLNILLIVVSFGLSRLTFYLVNDPEGPNLLIVSILAVVIFAVLRLLIKFFLNIFAKYTPV
jgi:hypothetical protein